MRPASQSLYLGTSPYVLIDARRTNLGSIKTDGIDFNLAYARQTGFGSINASVAGTYTLSRKTQPIAGNPMATISRTAPAGLRSSRRWAEAWEISPHWQS